MISIERKLQYIHRDLKQRCDNWNRREYKNYGWRWITYDANRIKFENFKKDMLESYLKHAKEYWEKNTTIDRINNNWNYCKENCKRATYKEQANNRRKRSSSIYIEYMWKNKNFEEWADEIWIKKETIRRRFYKWYSIIDTLSNKRIPRNTYKKSFYISHKHND
jgi:hypothetical protein